MTATATAVAKQTFTIVLERCLNERGYTARVPGWPGARSEGDTLDELRANMLEVIEMLLEDGPPELDAEFHGIETIVAGGA